MAKLSERRIAVIGFGPRGLGALEALAAARSAQDDPIAVDIYEGSETLGAGPNFDPTEIETCRLNIPYRDLDIRPPSTSKQGAFAQWVPGPVDPDEFPARAQIGQYLAARAEDLHSDARLCLTHCTDRIAAIEKQGGGWILKSSTGRLGPYAEVLLTVGQPAVEADPQLADWQNHVAHSGGTLANAYPGRNLAVQALNWTGQTVAIRGLALSAFDVIRTLTVAQGGRFEAEGYVPSGEEPARIVPFSLDGRPPFPKPATSKIDARFDPHDAETQIFLDRMREAAQAPAGAVPELINAALVPVILRLQGETGGGANRKAIQDWLGCEWDSAGSQEDGGPFETLREGIAMAEGRQAPGIGYTVGQVWRKWQNQVRQGYNLVTPAAETAAVLIGFDEGLKRYSYGPPVVSSRELLMLAEAGIVDLGFTRDPEIELTENGWALRAEGREIKASVMVDAVLPSPDLSKVTDPLIVGLAADARLCAIAEGLGATTAPDGTVRGAEGQAQTGLALLGRLALGSVIAADSLHDCFGASSDRWAAGVLERRGR